MDSAGSAGAPAAGLHRRHTPNRQNGASAMNPNADDGGTPNLGIDPTHTQRSPALDMDAGRHRPQRMGRLAVVDSSERLGRRFGRAALSWPNQRAARRCATSGSPPTGDVSEGMVPDARTVARAAATDWPSASESQQPLLRRVVRDPLVPNAFGRRFPWTAGHGPRCARR